jgi:hypothetical protein
MNNHLPRALPPWELTGDACVALYHLGRDEVLAGGFIPEALKPHYLGGPAILLLVDYKTSDVGPYHELLFIPGRFKIGEKSAFSVTRIYVSSEASAVNGRLNWGLPKQVAAFEVLPAANRRGLHVRVYDQQERVLDASFEHSRLGLPLWFPRQPLSIMQRMDSQLFFTRLGGRGFGHPGRLRLISASPRLFPDLSRHRPLMAAAFRRFHLRFCEADVSAAP